VSDNHHNLCLLTEVGEADKIQTWRGSSPPPHQHVQRRKRRRHDTLSLLLMLQFIHTYIPL